MRVVFTTTLLLGSLCVPLISSLRAEEESEEGVRAAAEVRLLDAGAEPRSVLRYRPVPGTSQAVICEVETDVESKIDGLRQYVPVPSDMVLRLDLHVDAVGEDGDVDCRMILREIDLLHAEKHHARKVGAFRDSMARLLGTTFHMTVNDRGLPETVRAEPLDYLPTAVEESLSTMDQRVLEMALYPLPREPVGVGARWTATGPVRAHGLAVEQTVTYELTEREGTVCRLSISVTQAVEEPTVDLPGLPAGSSARFVSHTAKGRAAFHLDLDKMAPLKGTLGVDSHAKLEIKAGARTRLLDQKMSMKMALTSRPARAAEPSETTTTPEPPSAGDAVRYVRELLDRVASGQADAYADRFDAETVVKRAVGFDLASFTLAERAELREAYRAGPALGGKWFEAWEGKLRAGELSVESVEAAPPRRDRVMVTTVFACASPSGPGCRASWILRQVDGAPRIVDYFDEEGVSVLDRMRQERVRLGMKARSPLVRVCRAFGVPVPLGAVETRPPEGGAPSWASLDALRVLVKLPMVRGAEVDAAGGRPDACMTIHLDLYGGVHYRLQGRDSYLDRAQLSLVLDRVRGAVRQAAASVDGGKFRVLVRADRRLQWHCATWVLELAWASGVRDLALGVTSPDGGHAVVPVSAVTTESDDVDVPAGAQRVSLVRLGRGTEAFTRVRLPGDQTVDLPRQSDKHASTESASEVDRQLQDVREALRAAVEEHGRRHWQVAAPIISTRPRPGRSQSHFGLKVRVNDVVFVLHMLRSLGVGRVSVIATNIPGREPPRSRPRPPKAREAPTTCSECSYPYVTAVGDVKSPPNQWGMCRICLERHARQSIVRFADRIKTAENEVARKQIREEWAVLRKDLLAIGYEIGEVGDTSPPRLRPIDSDAALHFVLRDEAHRFGHLLASTRRMMDELRRRKHGLARDADAKTMRLHKDLELAWIRRFDFYDLVTRVYMSLAMSRSWSQSYRGLSEIRRHASGDVPPESDAVDRTIAKMWRAAQRLVWQEKQTIEMLLAVTRGDEGAQVPDKAWFDALGELHADAFNFDPLPRPTPARARELVLLRKDLLGTADLAPFFERALVIRDALRRASARRKEPAAPDR